MRIKTKGNKYKRRIHGMNPIATQNHINIRHRLQSQPSKLAPDGCPLQPSLTKKHPIGWMPTSRHQSHLQYEYIIPIILETKNIYVHKIIYNKITCAFILALENC